MVMGRIRQYKARQVSLYHPINWGDWAKEVLSIALYTCNVQYIYIVLCSELLKVLHTKVIYIHVMIKRFRIFF